MLLDVCHLHLNSKLIYDLRYLSCKMFLLLFLAKTCFAATLQRMDLPESEYPGLLTISLLKTLHSSTLISPFSFTVTFIFEDTCFTLIFTFTFENTALYPDFHFHLLISLSPSLLKILALP